MYLQKCFVEVPQVLCARLMALHTKKPGPFRPDYCLSCAHHLPVEHEIKGMSEDIENVRSRAEVEAAARYLAVSH